MLDEKYINLLIKIANHYGKEKQVLQTIEEMSELTKELLKNINRNEENKTDVILEIADVIIMIMQLIELYGIDREKLLGAIEYKLLRQEERIKKDA